MRRIVVSLHLLLALCVAGCVSARDTHAVAQAQAEAIDRIAIESALTEAALQRTTNALLAIRIERVASEAELSILSDLITIAGDADHGALDAMLAQGDPPANPLARQVVESRMTAPDAHDWLETYAIAWRSQGGAATRRRLLESLAPVVFARAEAADLNAALRARAEAHAHLLAEARANAALLLGASESDPEIDALLSAAADSWGEALLGSIDDPARREAAARLIERLTNLAQVSADGIGVITKENDR